ncbi:MAG: hypothetical protein CMP57_00975 [Flavobacteriales bacterium]|nr:hypothetical protein [Flavobacteriales bacterium]|tara:strand:+ start:6390 stop:7043 length:654 start_codon:yes stop_codon:yes gene_type:complete
MKISLLLIFGVLSMTLLSQSLSINPQNYYYAETGETCSANFTVTNISEEDLDVVVVRFMDEYDITTYFCWGPTCYTPSSYFSTTPITIPAGQSFDGFSGYVQGIPEESNFLINYCFYPEDQPLDRVCAAINFTSIGLSVFNIDDSSVYPNPVNDYLYIDSHGAFNFNLYNLIGNVVFSQSSVGHTRLDISSFQSGIYFYSLASMSSNKELQKLVIAH